VPLLIVAVIVVAILATIAMIPVSLVLRYRAGTMRRPARRWVSTLNIVMLSLSTVFFLSVAAMTNVWVPTAFLSALAGLVLGAAVGVLGTMLTKWESSGRTMYFTPNRWLVLVLTAVVAGRVMYGFWRSWQAWQTPVAGTNWLAASGAAGSLAAGAVVIGYYLSYSIGVRRRAKVHGQRSIL
jgi:hypothetical protein